MPVYRVNYYDEDDMMTWLAAVPADSDDDAYRAAEEYRLKYAICPDITEIYSIENTTTSKVVFLSTRAGGSGRVLPETPSKEELGQLETLSYRYRQAQKMLAAVENDPSYLSDRHDKAISECEESKHAFDSYLDFLTARYPGYEFKS